MKQRQNKISVKDDTKCNNSTLLYVQWVHTSMQTIHRLSGNIYNVVHAQYIQSSMYKRLEGFIKIGPWDLSSFVIIIIDVNVVLGDLDTELTTVYIEQYPDTWTDIQTLKLMSGHMVTCTDVYEVLNGSHIYYTFGNHICSFTSIIMKVFPVWQTHLFLQMSTKF